MKHSPKLIKSGSRADALSREYIAAGRIVAYRTDTLYGLGVNPRDGEAVRRLRTLKGGENKPTLILVSDLDYAQDFIVHSSKLFETLLITDFGGAVTVVTSAREDVPEELTAGKKTIGIRLPRDGKVQNFLRVCGGALTATSANKAGASPARTAKQVEREFADSPLLIVDDGESTESRASTIVDISNGELNVLRTGAADIQHLLNLRSYFKDNN